MDYTPPKKILERYADVMVNFALGGGKGIRRGDIVLVRGSDAAKPLYLEVLKAVWKAGGHVIQRYHPDNERWFPVDRTFYEIASDEQLHFFPKNLLKAQIETIDHTIAIMADTDMQSLKSIDPKRMMISGKANKPYKEWFFDKVNKGKLSWSLCLYGTDAMAQEAGMTKKEYWNQIIKACFLDKQNPIAEWRKVSKQLETLRKKLNNLKIEKVHVEGPDANLWLAIGKNRTWALGGGANIPSFEIFTSPNWTGTEGWIRFNQPLYQYGNLVEGIKLEFRSGRVVKSTARKNEKVLKAMIETEGADKVGEFSLTDKRFSRITRFMAETLFDENIGGPNGNTHIALGSAYRECFRGDPSKLSQKEWAKLGYNDSSVHTDIVSTVPRTVTAYLSNGKKKVIYKDGQFTL